MALSEYERQVLTEMEADLMQATQSRLSVTQRRVRRHAVTHRCYGRQHRVRVLLAVFTPRPLLPCWPPLSAAQPAWHGAQPTSPRSLATAATGVTLASTDHTNWSQPRHCDQPTSLISNADGRQSMEGESGPACHHTFRAERVR